MKSVGSITGCGVQCVTLLDLNAAPSGWRGEPGRARLHKVMVSPPGVQNQTKLTRLFTNKENTHSMIMFSGNKLKHSGFKKAAKKSTHMYRRVR